MLSLEGRRGLRRSEATPTPRWPRRRQSVTGNQVVTPYLFDVRIDAKGVHPGEGARDHPRRRPDACAPIPASRQARSMYRYDEFDAQLRGRARRAVPRPGGAPPLGRTDRGPVQAAAADERALSAAARLHAAHRRSLRHAVVAGRCACWRISRANTTRASAISPPAPTSSSTGSSWWTCPTSWPIWPTSRCTASRPAATASAMSPPIISPAPPPTRSKIRARWPRSSGNGRACIPNSSSCRASSRSRSAPRAHDRAALQFHDMAVRDRAATPQGRIGYQVLVGGGMGRTPYIAHVMGEFVEREDILAYLEAVLRVYNQDSRRDNIHKRASRSWSTPSASEEMRAPRRRANSRRSRRMGTLQLPPEELDAHRRLFRAAGVRDRCPTRCRQATRDFAELGEDQCPSPIARPAMPSPPSRSRPSARCRAMPAPTRWTPSPI